MSELMTKFMKIVEEDQEHQFTILDSDEAFKKGDIEALNFLENRGVPWNLRTLNSLSINSENPSEALIKVLGSDLNAASEILGNILGLNGTENMRN